MSGEEDCPTNGPSTPAPSPSVSTTRPDFFVQPPNDTPFGTHQLDPCQSPIRPPAESLYPSPYKDFFASPLPNGNQLDRASAKLRCDDELLFTPERSTRNPHFDLELSPLPELQRHLGFQADSQNSKCLLSPLRSPLSLRTPQRLSPGLHPFSSPIPSPKDLPSSRVNNSNDSDLKNLTGIPCSNSEDTHSSQQPQQIWPNQPLGFNFNRGPGTPPQPDRSREISAGARTLQSTLESTGTSCQSNVSPHDKKCNCKNSKCLKLYCVCFSNQRLCKDCSCQECLNTEATMDKVIEARSAKMSSDPSTFNPKIIGYKHQRGCHCKRGCQKKYCECFSAGISCGASCKCLNCLNQIVVSADRHDSAPMPSSPQTMYSQPFTSNYDHSSHSSTFVPEPVPLPQSVGALTQHFHQSEPQHSFGRSQNTNNLSSIHSLNTTLMSEAGASNAQIDNCVPADQTRDTEHDMSDESPCASPSADGSPSSRSRRRRGLPTIMRPRKKMVSSRNGTQQISSDPSIHRTDHVEESPGTRPNNRSSWSLPLLPETSAISFAPSTAHTQFPGRFVQPDFDQVADDIKQESVNQINTKRDSSAAFSSPTRAAAKKRALEGRENGHPNARGQTDFCVMTSPVEKDMTLLRMQRRSLEPSATIQHYGGLITVTSVHHIRNKPSTPTWRTAIGVKRSSATFT